VSTNDDRPPSGLGPPDEHQRGVLGRALPLLEPPGRLESRVLDTLTRRGLLSAPAPAARRAPRWRVARALVAAAAVFAAGALAGRASRPAADATATTTPRFVLLLYDGDRATSDADEAARVEEHRSWARALAARGRSVTGEKLAPSLGQLGPAGAPEVALADSSALGGFFIISATDANDAIAVARTSPLLRHGGRVVVRPVDPT
jgi:hypothetical protein